MSKASQNKELYGSRRVTIILVQGSLYVAVALTSLLFIHDFLYEVSLRPRVWIALVIIALLSLSLYLAKLGKTGVANWLLIGQYELLAAIVLLNWGLESMVGIVTASFAILLPSILMKPRHILGVVLMTFGIVITVYLLQILEIVTPEAYPAKQTPSILDIAAYCTILAVFALVSWVSSHQSAQSFARAKKAEAIIRKQKDSLAQELERQSSELRQAQLQQIQQLYKFAIIGQSSAATLHELSNQLSVLNLDIDDLRQQHQQSQALANAEDSVKHMNIMVRKVRAQLNAQNISKSFKPISHINKLLEDMMPQFNQHQIKLLKTIEKGTNSITVTGDPTSLMQIINILLKNSLDACYDVPNALVTLNISIKNNSIRILVTDNGPGIDESLLKLLFQPVESSKTSGLGVGLYLAKQLVESQFNGTLNYIPSTQGASFEVLIPSS